jgi:hypothetical protein
MDSLLSLEGPLRLDIVCHMTDLVLRGIGSEVIRLCGKAKCGNGWILDRAIYG